MLVQYFNEIWNFIVREKSGQKFIVSIQSSLTGITQSPLNLIKTLIITLIKTLTLNKYFKQKLIKDPILHIYFLFILLIIYL